MDDLSLTSWTIKASLSVKLPGSSVKIQRLLNGFDNMYCLFPELESVRCAITEVLSTGVQGEKGCKVWFTGAGHGVSGSD